MDKNQKPVPYAHIIEKNRHEGWVCDYYGHFQAEVYPKDTLIISAVSFHHEIIGMPDNITNGAYHVKVTMEQDTVQLKELVIYPWPSTYSQLKQEFMEIDVDDPSDQINLQLPSLKDLAALARTPGVPGQIGLYSGSGPVSLLYDRFSKEARSKRLYADAIKKDKAYKRYNKVVVSRITGLKNDDEIRKFMEFCALQINFILTSTDYELYAAVLQCFDEYCKAGLTDDQLD